VNPSHLEKNEDFRKTPTNRNETFSEFTQGKLQQITIIPDNITEDSTVISHHTTADKRHSLKVTSLSTSTLT